MQNELDLSKKVQLVASGVALTSAWVAGKFVPMSPGQNYLGLLITYTKGDETGMEIKVEGSMDVSLGNVAAGANATNFYQRVTESTTGGAVTVTPGYFEIKATGNYAEVVYPIKADVIRISAQADTLGSSPGTYSIWAVTSWV